MGTFVITEGRTPNGNCPTTVKVGGNVAAYFCTPDRKVLGMVAGNVTPEVFLQEAGRAVVLAGALARLSPEKRDQAYREAHLGWSIEGAPGPWSYVDWSTQRLRNSHAYLAGRQRVALDRIQEHVFLCMLGEKMSEEPVKRQEGGFPFLHGNTVILNQREAPPRCEECRKRREISPASGRGTSS